eukprot:CAMPEP_0198647076 /NCGR_PEP_ID=MMETSP1467-20131203/2439_1 /TAXON_ID=1462469 /ORGANISM="unid. sp., Strain CCMP2135" /LENGTH=571 /DNA_ID=CAMNT_0044382677 /DNA_START=50 /DNA_END=1762 /DNA_ORIENTATION=-
MRGHELVGRLYKKRGGLGRHAKSPWVSRTFALGYDGVLSYFDSEHLEKPRGSLNLPRAEAWLSVVPYDPNDDMPTKFMFIITHVQGQRWKLCADSAAELEDWVDKMAKFCRSNAIRMPRAAAPEAAADTTRAAGVAAAATPPLAPPPVKKEKKHSVPGGGPPGHRERRPTKPTVKDFAVTATRTTRAWVRVASAVAAVNAAAILAHFANSGLATALALCLANVHVGLVIARCLAESPPTSETLVAMIVPPARLPAFVQRERRTSLTTVPEDAAPSDADEAAANVLAGLREVPFDPDGGPPGTWSRAPAATFRLRDVGYAKHKRKMPSDDAFYDVVAVHLFDCETRVDKIVDRLGGLQNLAQKNGAAAPAPTKTGDVPSWMVVNAQIPAETGPLRAQLDADGHGYHVVVVLEMTERTKRELEELAAGTAFASSARGRALALLQNYCRVAPSEPQLGAKERGRFKVLAQVRNIDEVDIPNFVKGYNGKPALINKTGILTKGAGGDLLEMAINCHAFGYLARKGLQTIYRDFQDFILSVGFVIEARDDLELPEVALAAFDMNHPNWTMASELPW